MSTQPTLPAFPTIRTLLRLDAVASGAIGLLLLALTGPAESELGLPVTFSVVAGLSIVVWSTFVAWVSIAAKRSLVTEVIVLNVAYVVASVLLAVSDWIALTDLGVGFVLAQGLAVLGLTGAQYAAHRAETGSPVLV